MSKPGRLTPAQQRARKWLPEDGSWRPDEGIIPAALNSLSLAWPGCIECEWVGWSIPKTRYRHWRFTAKGVA
jgi:hypothetical protein